MHSMLAVLHVDLEKSNQELEPLLGRFYVNTKRSNLSRQIYFKVHLICYKPVS